jgi:hypothetical protein
VWLVAGRAGGECDERTDEEGAEKREEVAGHGWAPDGAGDVGRVGPGDVESRREAGT